MLHKIKQLHLSLPLLLIGVSGCLVVVALLFITIFYQRQVHFSYAGTNCFRDVTFLPKLFKVKGDGAYQLQYTSAKAVRGYPFVSTVSCVTPVKSPQEKSVNKVNLSILGVALPNKKFKVVAHEFPKLNTDVLGEKISIREPITLELSKPDNVFSYQLSNGQESTDCTTDKTTLSCDVASLKLQQNQQYELAIERHFRKQKQADVTKATVMTVEPVGITGGSIVSGAAVYHKPDSVVLQTNKPLKSARVSLKMEEEELPQEVELRGNELIVKFAQNLPRKARFELVVHDALAEDKGILFEPYRLSFSTSGGPRVTAVNIGTSSVEPGQSVVITFDQALAAQDATKLISINTGSTGVTFKPTLKGKQLVLTPSGAMPICSKFSIALTSGFTNEHGIDGDSAKNLSSRIRCYSTFTLGSSVQGRAILGWRFGSGPAKYLYLGGTHGNEKSSTYLMEQWIKELDANYDRVGADKTIIVIPNLNPDAFAVTTRRNANNVDLNRNFPANDWKKDVTMPGGQFVVNGGGSAPLSEPESQAIASFIQTERPRLVLTYHSVARLVSGNSTGDSDILAQRYANLSRYKYLPFGQEAEVFHYDTTGAFENWLHDKIGIPTILVELGSNTNSEFGKNQAAMWAMLE